jgi:lysyl-tRNA synthetase, class II
MLFKIDPIIFSQYPGFTLGLVVAHDINNTTDLSTIQDQLNATIKKLQDTIVLNDIADHPHIAPWRHAYKQFGANPKKYLSSVENLTTRSVKKGQLGHISTAVDIYNLISLKYLLPAGGEDLATIVGDIRLTVAGDNEKPIVLLGDTAARVPEKGEVFYADDNGAICRRWNWKEADRTKLTANTKNAVFVLELLPPVNKQVLEAAVYELGHLLERYCGGSAAVAFLDEKNPSVALKKNGTYIPLNPLKDVDVLAVDLVQHKASEVAVDSHAELSHEHAIRVAKVHSMREAGIEPWPAFRPINATCQQVHDEFQSGHEGKQYQVAGRLIAFREHGKTAFGHILDRTGKVQLYFRQDLLGDDLFAFIQKNLDLGDSLWCSGESFKTKTGEVTLKVTDVVLLSKCLYPLPEKFHGMADVETRYRQRYLDLIAQADSRARFAKRSKIIAALRHVFAQYEFMEVETPMLHPIPGGAAAKPFVTHHNVLDADLYLRIAPELYLKRLVVGGFERVYELNRNFRNEGVSTRHNPEFTAVEWYIAHHDYVWMMDFTENLIKQVAAQVCDDVAHIAYGQYVLDFTKPFTRMSMAQAVAQYAHCTESDVYGDAINKLVSKYAVKVAADASWGYKLYALFEQLVEPNLIQPTFITEFPVEVSPLAKRNASNPALTDRFELFIAHMEIANAFTELNDPFDQAERFKQQAAAKTAGDEEAHAYDADFIHALEYGMPPTVGAGIGVDRLVMLLTNTTSIKDVILFPALKKK